MLALPLLLLLLLPIRIVTTGFRFRCLSEPSYCYSYCTRLNTEKPFERQRITTVCLSVCVFSGTRMLTRTTLD